MRKKVFEKNEILEKICVASRIENLGLFIGSGFPKALMKEEKKDSPSWLELLKLIAKEFGIDDDFFNNGLTYPLIASNIIEKVSEKESISIDEANKKVKNSIAKNVNYSPSNDVLKKYGDYFKEIKPCWIITTNYDSVIEKVVGPTAYPILPNYLFYNTKNILPIYHIHGSVLDSQSIVITNEDYAKMMRPSDYRHSRLPILLQESTVLMIGYALGDLNVLSAIDYRNNVYNNLSLIDNTIIQLVYTKTPRDKCYENKGVIIYEFSSLSTFFSELADYIIKYKSRIGLITNQVNTKQEEFVDSSDKFVNMFTYNQEDYRKKTIAFINDLDNSYCYLYTQYISFLDRVFETTIELAYIAYNFVYYNYYIEILIDLLKEIRIEIAPTVYISFLVKKLDLIAYHLGDELGKGHKAYQTWNERKKEIPIEFINYVNTSLNELNNKIYLKRLLDKEQDTI